ncbi:hypothetical protein ACR2R6_12915 [Methylocaldum gracile subsp. desertum]|uniref:hypothetical protein n=1 Tax=Methylocaldum sp. GT1BW TaxID=3438964 RepID=UPI003DA12EB3
MSLTFERFYPWIFAAAGLIIGWLMPVDIPSENRTDLYSAAISLGSIFAGFLTTTKAILMALPSDGLIGRLKISGYMSDLTSYLGQAVCGCLLFCGLNLIGFFSIGGFQSYFDAAWVGLATFSASAFWRTTSIMLAILRNP